MRGELYFLLCSNFWLFNVIYFFFSWNNSSFFDSTFTRDRVCVTV